MLYSRSRNVTGRKICDSECYLRYYFLFIAFLFIVFSVLSVFVLFIRVGRTNVLSQAQVELDEMVVNLIYTKNLSLAVLLDCSD
jgi:hypothetical protein